MNSYETVNDVLVKLFNEIMDVEERRTDHIRIQRYFRE